MNRRILPLAVLLCLTLFAHEMTGQNTPATNANSHASIEATLMDKDANAQKQEADVRVKVSGVKLTDPDVAKEKARNGQAHIHYRVDDGPVIATTATKLSFHQLSPGEHKITVMLAGNDHQPLGAEQTLTLMIPAMSATR